LSGSWDCTRNLWCRGWLSDHRNCWSRKRQLEQIHKLVTDIEVEYRSGSRRRSVGFSVENVKAALKDRGDLLRFRIEELVIWWVQDVRVLFSFEL
jgi:hypothetical protein